MKKYTPTGFPLGRPRMGETRPETTAILARRKYREANREKLNEQNRIFVAQWRAKNPERAKQSQKMSRLRHNTFVNWLSKSEQGIDVTWSFDLFD